MLSISLNPRYATRTIGDSIYLSLREDILSMRIAPGAELSIKDVADKLQVSRSPVRDALMRLASESLVDIYPQRGCRVSPIDMHRVEQELFMREGLETLAISRFVIVADEDDFSRMERYLKHQERDMQAQNHIRMLDDDERFHGVLFEATDQTYSLQVIRISCVHYYRIRLLSYTCETISESVLKEHTEMLAALRGRDAAKCIALERDHLHHVDIQQTQMLESHPDYFLK